MRDAFSDYHPAVNFAFFAAVILFSMFIMHPIFLAISLFASVAYAICLKGAKAVRFSLLYMLPMILLVMIINPAFNHSGITILTYLPSGNPLTLESILYGFAAACMMAAVLQWFYCYSFVMTSDKFVYLFGKLIPSLSLVLSMALRFVPKFHAQFKTIREAQRCIGNDISYGSVLQRTKNTGKILGIMITWAMENAIETADSMKSRGYGLPGRTAFSIYHFEKRDITALLIISVFSLYIIIGSAIGGVSFTYLPSVTGTLVGIYAFSIDICYLFLCFTPVLLHIKEEKV